MTDRARPPSVWIIWGLLCGFAVIQATAWIATGGVPRRPAVLVEVVAAWIVILILAAMAARRIGTLSARLSQNERAQLAALSEVEQLQTQNAILEIVARSVDVTLAFQALALRIARLVPCDRVGLALLGENGFVCHVRPSNSSCRGDGWSHVRGGGKLKAASIALPRREARKWCRSYGR